jgi:hypothetical protein
VDLHLNVHQLLNFLYSENEISEQLQNQLWIRWDFRIIFYEIADSFINYKSFPVNILKDLKMSIKKKQIERGVSNSYLFLFLSFVGPTGTVSNQFGKELQDITEVLF